MDLSGISSSEIDTLIEGAIKSVALITSRQPGCIERFWIESARDEQMAKATGSVRDRLIRAKRIRTRSGLNWTAFTQRWAAFNHLYARHGGDTEEDCVMNFTRDHLNRVGAERVLDRAAAPIEQVLELPPGDMRFNVQDDRFRARARRHAAIVTDVTQGAVERVAHLAAVLYQVRNNLLHGDKDPVSPRDRRLVRACAHILDELLRGLEASIMT